MSHTLAYKKNYLAERSFRIIKETILANSGIHLTNNKVELVKNRLIKRLKALKIDSFHKYCDLLQTQEGKKEIPRLIDAISTNMTSFFRESAHYRFLYDQVLPAICKHLNGGDHIRIWSAACSSGEEPYSIAMVADTFFSNKKIDYQILATDICNDVLDIANKGIYRKERLREVPNYFRKKYFKPHADDYYKINPQIVENKVHFRRLNLTDGNYPFKNKFDLIFCRNVLIYFDDKHQKQLTGSLSRYLKIGGYLFLGHAESLNGKVSGLKYVAPAVYMKEPNAE